MTRYPKSGKGYRWRVAKLKALTPASAGDIPRDGDGLVGTVRCAGVGRTAERIEGRQRVQATIDAEARRLAEDASMRAMYGAWLADGVLAKTATPRFGVPSRRMCCQCSARNRPRSYGARPPQPWRRLLQEDNPTNLIEIERIVAAD